MRLFTVTVAVAGLLLQATGAAAFPGLTDVVIAKARMRGKLLCRGAQPLALTRAVDPASRIFTLNTGSRSAKELPGL